MFQTPPDIRPRNARLPLLAKPPFWARSAEHGSRIHPPGAEGPNQPEAAPFERLRDVGDILSKSHYRFVTTYGKASEERVTEWFAQSKRWV